MRGDRGRTCPEVALRRGTIVDAIANTAATRPRQEQANPSRSKARCREHPKSGTRRPLLSKADDHGEANHSDRFARTPVSHLITSEETYHSRPDRQGEMKSPPLAVGSATVVVKRSIGTNPTAPLKPLSRSGFASKLTKAPELEPQPPPLALPQLPPPAPDPQPAPQPVPQPPATLVDRGNTASHPRQAT